MGSVGGVLYLYTPFRTHSVQNKTASASAPTPAPCVTFHRVAVALRGPEQSPALPFACCAESTPPPPRVCTVSFGGHPAEFELGPTPPGLPEWPNTCTGLSPPPPPVPCSCAKLWNPHFNSVAKQHPSSCSFDKALCVQKAVYAGVCPGEGLKGQAAVSVLGPGHACSPRLSSPAVRTGRHQLPQVH